MYRYEPILDDLRILESIKRFGGVLGDGGRKPLNVLQHSVLCYHICQRLTPDANAWQMALLHDGHEIIIGDITSPVKDFLGIREHPAIADLDRRIFRTFYGQPLDEYAELVSEADVIALHLERELLWPSDSPDCMAASWPPKPARFNPAWAHLCREAYSVVWDDFLALLDYSED